MNKLNDLYNLAEKHDISVLCFRLDTVKSLSVQDKNGKEYIAIDEMKVESSADETVRLAHELGHCETGAFYNRYSTYDLIGRQEYKADKWAIKKLIPADELKDAFIHGITEPWDLAEYFNVTEDFIVKAVEYYKNNSILH